MAERDLVKKIIEFSFLIKAQLSSEETALLRAALALVIMEAEEVLESMDTPIETAQNSPSYHRIGSLKEA